MAMEKSSSTSWQDVLSGTHQRLIHLFNTGCFSDIVIKCPGGVAFELHRMMLAMCSPVFEAMMFGPLATSKDNLCLEDDPAILKHVFAYCYGCDFQCDDINVVLEIFKIADKYILNDLKNVCVRIILKLMKPESFKFIYEFTVKYGYTDLRNSCISFLQEDSNITNVQCYDINVVLEIFKIADKYMLNDLRNGCVRIILKLMKPESFKVIYEFTVKYGYNDLRNTCISFLQEDSNITKATAVLKWFSLNSPKYLQIPVFAVYKLIFDTWRHPKSEEPFYELSTILKSNCYNDLKEYAGQFPGDVLQYIPGPLRTSLTDLRDSSYAPVLKIYLQNDNAEEVVKALHVRFNKYGPEDIGIHITNEDIPSIFRKLSKLPCYKCASEDMGRLTLYFSDLTKENLHYIHNILERLDPDCKERNSNNCDGVEHRFVHSYMFPRCKLTKEDFSLFGEQIIAWDEWFLLPECQFRVQSSCIETKDEDEIYNLAILAMRNESLEMWEFFPHINVCSNNDDIPGW